MAGKKSVLMYAGEINGTFLMNLYQRPDRLVLCSEGGDLYVACAALDFLEANKIEIVATGACFSAAIPILACGTNRIVTHRTRLFLHPARLEGGGERLSEMRLEGKEMELLEGEYLRVLAARTNRDRRFWRKMMKEETYFGAEEALQYGLVEEVV